MRAIKKGNEPDCLTEHRTAFLSNSAEAPHSHYGNYPGKDALRAALVAEQRGVCCYCMSRISADGQKMKIEHWQSQTNEAFKHLQLTYSNLLGACYGNEKGSADLRHCDTRKGEQNLLFNPANPAHAIETRINYRNNGEIRSGDPQFDAELDTVLNLNIPFLKNSRKGVLEVVLLWWQKKAPSKALVQNRINKYDNGNDKLAPFAPVAVWFLKRKLVA